MIPEDLSIKRKGFWKQIVRSILTTWTSYAGRLITEVLVSPLFSRKGTHLPLFPSLSLMLNFPYFHEFFTLKFRQNSIRNSRLLTRHDSGTNYNKIDFQIPGVPYKVSTLKNHKIKLYDQLKKFFFWQVDQGSKNFPTCNVSFWLTQILPKQIYMSFLGVPGFEAYCREHWFAD